MEYQIVNGQILHQNDALIPLSDLGMLRGYGVFDYFRVREGKPVFIADHIERLFHSMELMDMELDFERHHVKDMVIKLIEKNEAIDCAFRIVVTGGYSSDGYHPDGLSNLYMMLQKAPEYPSSAYEKGVKLISTAYQRDVPAVKTTNYIQAIHSGRKMEAENAMEVLYHWDGTISECSRANIFFLDHEGTLVTPSHGMLKGVTRMYTIGIAEKLGIQINLRKVEMDEIDGMREAFITSTTKGIMPVIQIDDHFIGDGMPGEITEKLISAFSEEVHAYLTERS